MERIKEIDLVSEKEKYLIDFSNLENNLFLNQRSFLSLNKLKDYYNDVSLGMPIMLPIGLKSFDYTNVDDQFEVNIKEFSQKIFLTDNFEYIGVKKYFKYGNIFCTGAKPKEEYFDLINLFQEINIDLQKKNKEFLDKGKKVIAFQTRNIPHLGHEKIIEMLLGKFDYLLINPVIGPKKRGDVKNEILFEVFKYLSEKKYDKRILFYPLCANMFYGGPREAIHHAIIRKQSGFKAFVVGRDHAGAEDNYDPDEALNLVNEVKDKIGMKIITHRGSFYDETNNQIVIKDNFNMHNKLLNISGSEFRKSLEKKEIFKFARKDLQDFLFSLNQDLFY